MKPMVSVIVPVYNAEQTIRRCVASILDQQFTDLELLLVDDGSTDGSGAICDEFAARDARVTAIHQKNAGSPPPATMPWIWLRASISSFWTVMTGSPQTPPALWSGPQRPIAAIW